MLSTEEDKYMFANYSGFCAEFFAKFDVVSSTDITIMHDLLEDISHTYSCTCI